MFETKYNYDKLTVAQQTVYSRLLSSRTTVQGRLCDIINIACCCINYSSTKLFHFQSIWRHKQKQKKIRKRNIRVHESFALIKPFMTSAMFKKRDINSEISCIINLHVLISGSSLFHSNRHSNHGTNKIGVELNLLYAILYHELLFSTEKTKNTRLAAYHITAFFENWNY